MTEEERRALAALRFSWAQAPDDVWRRSPFHVDGLHEAVVRDVRGSIADARDSADVSPIGLVLEGRHGTGKTHLLGWVREQAQQQGGYFFLIGLLDERNFWQGVLVFMLDGLARETSSGETQLQLLLRRLSSRIGAPRAARRAVMGDTELTRSALDAFVHGLTEFDRHVALQCRDTLRALALRASDDEDHQDVAESYLGGEETVVVDLREWGIRRRRTAQEVVRDISWILALTGPTVIAFDQIDTALAQAAAHEDLAKSAEADVTPRQAAVVTDLANGLTDLRDMTRRTVTMVTLLSTNWSLIESHATASFAPRFRRCMALEGIRNPRIARELIEKRFSDRFRTVRFVPPYPTWPIQPQVFEETTHYTPRRLLIDIDRHIRACLVDGEVRELRRLSDVPSEEQQTRPAVAPAIPEDAFARIEARFEELKNEADVTSPLERDTEDTTFPALLAVGLQAWIAERGDSGAKFSVDPPPSSKPDLHARLRRDLDERSEEERESSPDQSRTEDQAHWSFRAISDTHHGTAALHRIRRARTAAGLNADVAKRRLFLLRNGPWSQSARTQEEVQKLKQDGGVTLGVTKDDLRVLAALDGLRDENPAQLQAWLVRERPTEQITFFKEALADADAWTGERTRPAEPESPSEEASFTIGLGAGNDAPASISLEALRKHAAIFAASGSGKTVLLRRLVEECALRGVSAIVLDPNNDLARLGDRWPAPPDGWWAGDEARAARYSAEVEVLTWTPRRETGRPLSFQPLPDFQSVRDDPDEFAAAVEAAAAALAPRANLVGRAQKVHLGTAVLRKTVEYYGRQGGSDLRGLIALLSDLPDGISDLRDAAKIAADLAQTLTAAMDNDPMFGGDGSPMDPGTLLVPAPGKRARISVISFIGLSPEAAQGFVNQLQMSLFAWIKKHPAKDRPLLGLLVMDEAQNFAPSGAMTACTQSTLALASQARKYGLGLIFATQAPKGLHNRIPGNAATQFFGRLSSPVQIEAAREMAKVKGGDVPDIGSLTAGLFYLGLEGEVPIKVRTPMSLSHHPSSPLTDEEVMARARA